MPRPIARFGVALVALGFCLLSAQSVQAGFVTYTTEGEFGSNNSNVITIKNGNAAVEITYISGGATQLNLPEANANFGSFIVKNIDPGSANINVSDTFTLTVSQTNPSNQTGTFESQVSGKIKYGTNNVVTVTIDSDNPITLGTITYLLPDSFDLQSPTNQLGATKTTYLTASISETSGPSSESGVTATPAPPALVLALAGIGCTGLFRRFGSRKAKAAE